MMEAKDADNASLAPLGRITSLQFSLATTEEIVKISGSEAIRQSSQLSGPSLGLPTESNRCTSCGTVKFDECEGHFGHIRLPTPVYHPSHVQEVVRIFKRICLNCLKLKKKKRINFVEEILQENKPIIREVDSNGKKSIILTNSKRKDICNKSGCDAVVTDASSISEEDPLLRSLIPIRTYRRRNAINKQQHDSQASKNFKAVKEVVRERKQHKKQGAVLGKRAFASSIEDTDYNKDEGTCKYCKVADKKSAKSYPAVDVKVVFAQSSNGGKIKEIKISSRKEVPHKFWDFLDRYSGHRSGNELSRTLLPFEALNILRQIPESTSRKFGIRPEALIWECLPVPPNCTRISGESVKTTRIGIDGAGQILKKIMNTVGRIRDSRGGKPTFDTKKHEAKVLQSLSTEYLRARGGPKVAGDKEPSGICDRNIGNAESISKVWGKRIQTLFLKKISGFSARSVVTGDAYIDIDEIGVPLEIAKGVTIEERVTVYNKKQLQNIVNKGFYTTLVERCGNSRSKEFLRTAKMVEVGEIIHRQLKDGDIVFVNRPPSIHKHSIQALKVRIQPSCSLSISPLICPAMDADFDGDCIHVFVPQSLKSQAEAAQLLTIDQQLISSQGGEILLTLTQDTLLAANLILSMPILDKMMMQHLAMWTLSALPIPAIIRSPLGGPYWTGSQLFQMCLPPGVNCIGNGLYIHNSEILSIPRSGKQLHGCVDLILHALIQQKGAREALKFLNSAQHCLMEWLSQEGFSVGLNDILPFHEPTYREELLKIINKCIDDVAPLMKHIRSSNFENMIIPFVQNHVREANKRVSSHISKSNSLFAITEAASGRSINKVVQQTGFLGLQIFKGKELLPREWSNRLFALLHGNKPGRPEINYCEVHGLIVAPFVDGLKPHEAFIHAVSARETLFCKAIGVKEPGTLFKNLMAFLRDIIICYDGTTRTTLGKHLVQFQYDCNECPEESRIKKQSLEGGGNNSNLKVHLQAGEPVGILAATSIANPSYKVLLEAVQRNISSWYLLKETLFRRFGSGLQLLDRKVTLRVRSCCCGHAYCEEKTALQIQRHLQKVPLKMFAVSIEVGYQSTNAMHDWPKTSSSTNSLFIGHVRLNKNLLEEANLSMDSLLSNLKRSINTKRNALNNLPGKLIFFTCDKCNGVGNSEVLDFEIPCLHFYLDTSNIVNENIVDIMVNVVCPELLETTAKGDDQIESVRILWSPVNSASWVPLQISSSQYIEGDIVIEVTVEESEVKQRGDAWKIVQVACLPVMDLLDTKRCVPYSIHETQECFGVSAAYYVLLQRLMYSINMMGNLVYKEHLVLVADCMTLSGNVVGLNAAGYRDFLRNMGTFAPFTEGTLQTPIKCFQKAAERGQEDGLSSTLASCSWGQHPSLGTGGDFEILWNNVQEAVDPSADICKHVDVHNFLEKMGRIPCGKEASSSELHLGSDFGDLTDGSSEFMHSDIIFGDAPTGKGISNDRNEGFMSVWDSAGKLPNEEDGHAKTNNLSGWEASTKSPSQLGGWVLNEEDGHAKINNLSGWEVSTKSPSQGDGWVLNEEDGHAKTNNLSGWEASTKSPSRADGWASNEEDDQAETNNLSGWEASTKSPSKADGWFCSTPNVEASECQTYSRDKLVSDSLTDEDRVKSSGFPAGCKCENNQANEEAGDGKSHSKAVNGWDTEPLLASDSTDATVLDGMFSGWEPNMGTNVKGNKGILHANETQTISSGNRSPTVLGKSDFKSDRQQNEITDVPGQNLSSGIIREEACTDGWQSPNISSTLEKGNSECTFKSDKNTWENSCQEDQVANVSGWNSNTETAGENDCRIGWQKNRISGTSKEDNWKHTFTDQNRDWKSGCQEDETANLSAWNSNTDTIDQKDCTGWHNSGKIYQQDISKGNDNQPAPHKLSLCISQKSFASKLGINNQSGKCFKGKYGKGNKCRNEESALLALEDPPFPPGFSFQDGFSGKNLFKAEQTGQDNEPKQWSADWNAKEGQNTGWTIQEPDRNSKNAESNIQDTSCVAKDYTTSKSCYTPKISTQNSESNVETKKIAVMEKHSDGWSPRSETLVVRPGWEEWNNEHVVSDNYAANTSGWEVSSQRLNSPTNMMCTVVDKQQTDGWNTSPGKDGPSAPNVFVQEVLDQSNSTWPSRTDNLTSSSGGNRSKGQEDEYKRSFFIINESGNRLKIRPTGANLVPLGKTRSSCRIQQEVCDRNALQEHNQNQQASEERLDSSTTCLTSEEPDRKSKHANSNIQDTLYAGKDSTVRKHFQMQKINGEVEVVHHNSNMKIKKNNAVNTLDEQRSDGWNPSPDMVVNSDWERWHNEDITCENDTPYPSDREFPVQSWNRSLERSCQTKSVEDVRPNNDTRGITSLSPMNKNKLRPEYKNENVRNETANSSNTEKLIQQICESPTKLQGILQEVNPLLHSTRRILHFSSYNSGDRLKFEDEKEVLEKILVHHPEVQAKIGCGVDFIMIDQHSKFTSSRCFYIVRKDGTRIDFSYLKCLKGLIEKKFPASAKAFIEKYLAQRK